MPGESWTGQGADIRNLVMERALREARGNLKEVHAAAQTALDKLSEVSLVGLSADELVTVVERFSEVKMMVALSSPEVVEQLQVQMAAMGRELTAEEKAMILAGVAPNSLRVSLS